MEKIVCVWERESERRDIRARSITECRASSPHRKTAAPPRPENTTNAAEHEVRYKPVQSIREYVKPRVTGVSQQMRVCGFYTVNLTVVYAVCP